MNKLLRGLLAGVFLAVSTVSSASEPLADHQDVQAGIFLANAWLENRLNYDRVPGASIAVVADQETVWTEGFGYARLRGKVPATPDTRYSICSVSKLFTSVGVMQLRDAGKLDLDAPLDQVLPWYDLPPHADAEEPVTLRNILSHVAGLPREAVTPYWVDEDFPARGTIQDGVGEQEALYRPYERFQYSNLGMSLAGEAIAAASGEDYHDYVRENILTPLGMSETTSELPVADYGKSFAAGYRLPGDNGKRPEVGKYQLNGIAPAAGFASSANDLARFAKWQFRLRENGGEEVIKATTLREMQRLQWAEPDMDGANWGLGFALSKVGKDIWVGHGGYCPGYRTSFLVRPQDKVAVAMMVNVNDVAPSNMVRQVIALMGPGIEKAAKANGESADDAAEDEGEEVDLGAYQGVYGREQMPINYALAATSKGLTGISLYSDKPADFKLNLRHEEGHVFRVYSKKDEPLHTVRFEVDEEGRATRMWMHGQYSDRLK
ncbi:MAG: serine hydrolase domain-containing protein [Halieaceae bacterium]|nr:serine hydrolase domain-containing protein [Halieaceae bacterium]